jgi:hypothetical protein
MRLTGERDAAAAWPRLLARSKQICLAIILKAT